MSDNEIMPYQNLMLVKHHVQFYSCEWLWVFIVVVLFLDLEEEKQAQLRDIV